MRILVILLLNLFVASVGGQIVNVKKHYQLKEVEGKNVFHPIFDPQGSQLLVTSEYYVGLDLLNIHTGDMVSITKEEGAGFNPVFSGDGQTILYQAAISKEKRQYRTLMNFDLSTKKAIRLSEMTRSQNDLNKIQSTLVQKEKRSFGGISVITEDLKIVLYQNGNRKELMPVGTVPGYIWVSLSPNGEMILFTAVSKGTFVCDLSGKVISFLGNLNAPVWYGNDYVVGMKDKDDGNVITSSQVIIATIDGKTCQELTPKERIALYPATSSVSKQIAYCTDKGELFIMEIDK